MKCTSCGQEIAPGASICSFCGSTMQDDDMHHGGQPMMDQGDQNINVQFYNHSGRFNPLLLVILPFMFIPALILGLIYSYMAVYIPIGGIVSFLYTFGFTVLLGMTAAKCVESLKTRNNVVAFMFGAASGVIGVYFLWVAFEFVFINSLGEDVPLLSIAINPLAVVIIGLSIIQEGWYTMGDNFTPKGWVLGSFSAIEAAVIIFGSGLIAKMRIQDKVFCEDCGRWANEEKGVFSFIPNDINELIQGIFKGDFSVLKNTTTENISWAEGTFRFDGNHCPKCENLHTLNLKAVVRTHNKKGEPTTNEEVIIPHILVSRGEYQTVSNLAASLPKPGPTDVETGELEDEA